MNKQNYEVMQVEGGRHVKMWTKGVPVEEAARAQLANTARMPFIYKHIAVMPDVHLGKGSTIGSVVPTLGAIIPAAVGVDIGCGMMAAKTTLTANDLPDSLSTLRSAIERAIPHGMSPKTRGFRGRDQGSWHTPPSAVDAAWATLKDGFDALCEKNPRLRQSNNHRHLGTLGSGNHFSELCIDESRIFSTGFSYGGMMSFAVGCARGDVFRAIAPMSGALYSGCENGDAPVAVWGAHGDNDDVVPLADGQAGLQEFLDRNGCGTATTPTEPSPCVTYEGCTAGVPVTWCEFSGGHSPPSFSAEAIWAFFSQF